MKIQYYTSLFVGCWALMSTNPLAAQHQHSQKCAINTESAAFIKQKMMDQRDRIPRSEVERLQSQRATIYIPLTMHIVGDAAGEGYVDLDEVLDMFCGLQNDYGTQDIQYYLNGQFRYINNTTLYNDGFSNGAGNVMWSNKVSNCLNAYASPSVNNAAASFYDGFGDYVFLLNAQLLDANQFTAPTTSHEFGHFFTLPHTFSGWEGTDYDLVYAGANAPANMGGGPTERVARTNCTTAGDGFCDTPADYFSERTPCPYTNVAKDFTGVQLDPDESNIMSYFYDDCVDNFSTEQKDAISTDIISRGWTGFTPPTTALLTTNVNLVSPAHNSFVNVSTGNVTFTWDALTNATGYYIEIDRSLFGSPIESIEKVVVYNTTSYTLPASSFQTNKQYTWKVRPFNAYHTCPGFSTTFNFTGSLVNVGVEDVQPANNLTMEVYPNPVHNGEVRIAVQSQKELMAAVRLYSADGKLLIDLENELIQAGENVLQLPTQALANGLYVLTLTTEAGTAQQKIVIEK